MSKVEVHDRILAALSDKSTFGFNELRLDKSVNDVLGDDVKIKNTLELFCFGSIKDYNGEYRCSNYHHYVQPLTARLQK